MRRCNNGNGSGHYLLCIALWLRVPNRKLDNIGLGAYHAHTFKAEYPGLQSYKDFKDSFRSGETTNYVLNEYVQAAALQRMERNTLSIIVGDRID